MIKGHVYSNTLINHQARMSLDLSVLEYCVADLIYQMTANPRSNNPGWCYAKKSYMSECLGISRQSIHNIMLNLESKKLIESPEGSSNVRTTPLWYETIVMCKKSLHLSKKFTPVKKVDTACKESLLDVSKKFTPLNRCDIPIDIPIDNSADVAAQGVGDAPREPKGKKEKDTVPLEKLQNVVLAFKLAMGVPADDKGWDKTDFGKTAPYAKELLIYFNRDDVKAMQCIEDIARTLKESKLSWSPKAVCTWKADWQAQRNAWGAYRGLGKASEIVQEGGD